MSNESDGSGKTAKAQPAKAADPKPAPAAPAKKDAEPLELEERRYSFEDLKRSLLVPDQLLAMLGDGRAHVRANAVLGLAASGQAVPQLVPVLRDSEAVAASAAAEAIAKLGREIRPLIPQIVAALDGTQPDITEKVIGVLAEQVGHSDEELILALDVPFDLAMKSIIPAVQQLGKPGVAFLIKAAKHERGRIRSNAVGGLARSGKTDLDAAMAFLTELEATDPVPDVRTAGTLSRIKRPIAAAASRPAALPFTAN